LSLLALGAKKHSCATYGSFALGWFNVDIGIATLKLHGLKVQLTRFNKITSGKKLSFKNAVYCI
jgi:hypothetical protein